MYQRKYILLPFLLLFLFAGRVHAQSTQNTPEERQEPVSPEASPEEMAENTSSSSLWKEYTLGMAVRSSMYLHEILVGTVSKPPTDVMLGIQLDGSIGSEKRFFYFQFAVLVPLIKANIYFYDQNSISQAAWSSASGQRYAIQFESTLGGGLTRHVGNQVRIGFAGGLHLAYIGHYRGRLTSPSTAALHFLMAGVAMNLKVIVPISRNVGLSTGIFGSLDAGATLYQQQTGVVALISQVGIFCSATIK